MSRLDETSNLPLFQKAELIYQLVESLVASLPKEDAYIQDTKHFMREDAMIISAKIAGAEGGDLYSIRMQKAAIIREHAMHLYVQVGSLRMHKNYKELEYIQLIRKELNDFRLLFIEWVARFNTNNHIWDDWGLFNPPGAIPPSEKDFYSENDFDFNAFFEDDEE